MRVFAEETITLPSDGTIKTLTSATYDNTSGGSRARAAKIRVRGAVVTYSLAGNPTASSGLSCGSNGDFGVEGYDNLTQLRLAALGGVEATLYVQYYN